MRCTSCNSYIPEGLVEPVVCPQCGRLASTPQRSSATDAGSSYETARVAEASSYVETETTKSLPFAPYFTLRTQLAFGLSSHVPDAGPGSISFGPEGFSVVWGKGKHWEKIAYRDLERFEVVGDAVNLSIRDIDSLLVLSHPWLPKWFGAARTKRATVFVDLLSKVRAGLTPEQIAVYQRKLL
ncbi:MAG: hypothetical protein AB1540_05680 [Bdellovibrionota bacterium]